MKHLTIHLARPGMNPFCAFWQRAVVMLFVMFTSMGMWATDYIDENGKPQSHNCTSFPDEGVNATTLSTGWYAVDRNVVYNYLCKRITINGDVKIIIQDGCSLRATFGIGVPEGSTLTIYGQSGNTGKLEVISYWHNGSESRVSTSDAGIGYTGNGSCGNINIHGGVLTVYGGDYESPTGNVVVEGSMAIGGSSSNITITGGKVTAYGGRKKAAIGGGTINISGGTVNAVGGAGGNNYASGAGIGGTANHGAGTINITGGYITATAYGRAHAIGTGSGGTGGTINISGGHVSAYSKDGGSSKGEYGIGGSGCTINLSWTNPTDFIENTKNYTGTVKLNKTFHADGTIINSGSVSDNATINGKKLMPMTLSGAGTASNPYIIENEQTWRTFDVCLQNNDTWNRFDGKVVKLVNDISVTTMAGGSYHDFCGTFDGDGHTLTVNYDTEQGNVAPFPNTENTCTIKNLHVKGTIKTKADIASGIVGTQYGTLNIINCTSDVTIETSAKYAAGMLGSSNGVVNITGCRSGVTINSSVENTSNNDGTHGGFIGVQQNKSNASINIDGCSFNGKLLSSNGTTACGGFVGWRQKTLNISNSIFAPSQITISNAGCATFARNNATKITNCYYMQEMNDGSNYTSQGKKAYSITAAQGMTVKGYGTATNDSVAGIIAYNTGLEYDGTLYATEGEQMKLSVNYESVINGYAVSLKATAGTLTGSSNPYTLAMPAKNVLITTNYKESPLLGFSSTYTPDGSEAKPYIITTKEGWDFFCDAIQDEETWNHFWKKHVKLGANITVSKMASTAEHQFSGTFNGGGKTLTFNKEATADGCAPFLYTDQATIKNLKVAGTISSSGRQIAGLIAYAKGNSTIDSCIVLSTLKSTYSGDASNGGFIANVESGIINISNCLFKGSMLGESATCSGGFIGWFSKNYGKLTDCVFAPVSVTMGSTGSNTFSRSYCTYKNCYYTTALGETEGYKVSATKPDNLVYKTVQCADNKTYYILFEVTNMNDRYLYNNGGVVTVSPKVRYYGDSSELKLDTDYTLTVRKSNNQVVALSELKDIDTYTLTVTGKSPDYVGKQTCTFSILNGVTLYNYIYATEGTGDNLVYLIKTEDDLDALATFVNSGNKTAGMTFKLANDITRTREHKSIGNIHYSFKGTFDGNSKKISKMTLTCDDYYRGFFGNLEGNAVIKDLTLEDFTINITQYAYYIGAIAGKTEPSDSIVIKNCHVNGNITSTTKARDIGGIVGNLEGNGKSIITGCTAKGSMTLVGGSYECGGIAGCAYKNANITLCENAMNITSLEGYEIGGIVGYIRNDNNHVSNCQNTGVIIGKNNGAGGVSGSTNNRESCSNCYTVGELSAFPYGDYAGKAEKAFTISKDNSVSNISIEGCSFTSMLTGKKYYANGEWSLTLNASAQDKSFVRYVCDGGSLTNMFTKNGVHTLTIADNDVTISAMFANNNGIDISNAEVTEIPEQRWKGGDAIEPVPAVTVGGTSLVYGIDFTIEYINNYAIGEGTAVLNGINAYKGTNTVTFDIKDFPLLNPEAENSANNPYLIYTEADIQALAAIVNNGARNNGYYRQEREITLTEEHTPIGTDDHKFEGTYDGFNKKIKGLYINKPDGSYIGLFGRTNDAYLNNIVIEDCDITGNYATAGVVGYGDGDIKYCQVSGIIKEGEGKVCSHHGGIAGYLWGNVEGCVNTASIKGSGSNYGGIAGYCVFDMKNCFNAGIVEGASYVGSIAGHCTSVKNCYHTAATTGGIGESKQTTGTDKAGAEVVVKISGGTGVHVTLPSEPTYIWNNENLYANGTVVTLSFDLPENNFFDNYVVSSGEISNAFTMSGEHTLTGFTEDVEITGTYSDTQYNLKDGKGTISITTELMFNNQEQKPLPVVKYNGETLTKDKNYSVTWSDDVTNAGEKTVIVTGLGHYTDTLKATYNILPFDINTDGVLSIDIKDAYPQTSSAVNPVPVVKCSGLNNVELINGTDFDLSYEGDCILPGEYAVTVTAKGNYTGEKTLNFRILDIYGLTVHDGTATNNTVPIDGWNTDNYEKCEFIMPASELAQMKGGLIKELSFYLSSKAAKSWPGTFQVFMKEVEGTTISKYDESDTTVVYTGSLDGMQDTMTVKFDNIYTYRGGNLLIGIYKITKDNNYSSASFYGESVTGACIQGNNKSSLASVPASARSFLPKTTFWYDVQKEDITFAPEGYATYYNSQSDIKLPAGVKARVVTAKANAANKLVYQTIADGDTDDNIVPAGTAVMLKTTASTKAQIKTITLVGVTATAYSGDNLLHGSDEAATTENGALFYKLTYSNSGDNFGWYWGAANGAAFTNPAHKAYLAIPAGEMGAKASFYLSLSDDEETTGIETVQPMQIDADDDVWYDMAGRKLPVKPNTPGMYIYKGKKVSIR